MITKEEFLKGKYKIQDWGENVPSSIHFGIICDSNQQRENISIKLSNHGVETRFFDAGNLGRHPFWYLNKGLFKHKVADTLYECGLFLPNNPNIVEEDIINITNII